MYVTITTFNQSLGLYVYVHSTEPALGSITFTIEVGYAATLVEHETHAQCILILDVADPASQDMGVMQMIYCCGTWVRACDRVANTPLHSSYVQAQPLLTRSASGHSYTSSSNA